MVQDIHVSVDQQIKLGNRVNIKMLMNEKELDLMKL